MPTFSTPDTIRSGGIVYYRHPNLVQAISAMSAAQTQSEPFADLPRTASIVPSMRALRRILDPTPERRPGGCCCCCDEPAPRDPARAAARLPDVGVLNVPRHTAWVHTPRVWTAPAPAGTAVRPVYVTERDVYALDPRIVYIRSAAPGPALAAALTNVGLVEGPPLLNLRAIGRAYYRLVTGGRGPELVPAALRDLDGLSERLSHHLETPTTLSLHWIPASSPAANWASAAGQRGARTPPPGGWHLAKIGLDPPPIDPTTGAPVSLAGLSAALIDVDIFPKHVDFADGTILGASLDLDEHPVPAASDEFSSYRAHGTCCAGILVASDDSGGPAYAATGAAPGIKLVGYDVVDWSFDSVCRALEDVIKQEVPVAVLTMSFAWYRQGTGEPSLQDTDLQILADLLYRAHRRGIVLVAAAGNVADITSTTPTPVQIGFPAQDPHVIAVGALDPDDGMCWNSAGQPWGSRFSRSAFRGQRTGVSVVAPGLGILTTDCSGDATDSWTANSFFNGTSAAAPQVAAVALHVIRRYGLEGDPAKVRWILEATARKPEALRAEFAWDSADAASTTHEHLGHGVVDAAAALDFADVSVAAADIVLGKELIRVTAHEDAVLNRPRNPVAYAWHVPDDTRWQLERSAGGYTLTDIVQSTRIAALERSPSDYPTFEFELGDLRADRTGSILVVVDADNDHAFRNAHDFVNFAHRIRASSPERMRCYNNIACVSVKELFEPR